MTDTPKVQILLATYNGERFLQQQLDSIAAQTYADWEILARDDGSRDNTVEILKRFQAARPGKLKILEDNLGNSGSPAKNFLILAAASSSDIVAFADQDDIWHPEKVGKMVAAIQKLEVKYGAGSPAMVHHDFSIIDADDKVRTASFAATSGFKSEAIASAPLIGLARGFSLAANKALVKKALPAPDPLLPLGHDTIFSHVGKKLGHIEFIDEPLVQYRRHETNVSHFTTAAYTKRALKDVFMHGSFAGIADRANTALEKARLNLRNKTLMTRAFVERYGEELDPSVRKDLEGFVHLEEQGFWKRKQLILRYSSPHMLTRVLAALTM